MRTDDDRQADAAGTTSLQQLVGLLRRRRLLILVAVLVCAAAPVVHALLSTPTYEATARVLVDVSRLSEAAFDAQRGSGDAERDDATNVALASSEGVATRVRQRLDLDRSVEAVRDQVTVEAEANADILSITAADEQPALSASLANAFAREYIAVRAEGEIRSIEAAERELRRQLASLPPESALTQGEPDNSALLESLQQLAALRAVATGDARILDEATAPASPASPGPLQAGIIGAIVGLALGLALAFVREASDRRPRSLEEVEHAYGLPVLTVVSRRHFKHRSAEARAPDLEAFRILRNSADMRAGASVLVTSAMPGEGKTTVAVDLAHALALTGRRVVLVELDLRQPTFSEHFRLSDDDGGVVDALAGRRVLDLLQQPLVAAPDLWVLPAGRLPSNPAELLGSAAVNDLLQELADGETTLVIDAPPLLPVADTQALLRQPRVDSTLIVSRLGLTSRDAIKRARAVLDRQGREPLGLVVTGHQAAQQYGHVAYPTTDDRPRQEVQPGPQRVMRTDGAVAGRDAPRR